MDMFAEQLVAKEQSSSDTLKKTMIIVGGAVMVALSVFLMYIFPLTFIVGVGILYLMYILLTGLNVEYEYAATNGTLDIDKIIAKRKRVEMLSVSIKDFTAFGTYDSVSDDFDGVTIMTVGGDETAYYANFPHETHGNVRLVFSPDERMLECIRPFLPRNLK